MNYFIGLDSGGTFMKAALLDRSGHQIAIAKVSAKVINSKQGWVERDLDALWDDAKAAISKLLTTTDINVDDIKGISISAQGKGVYLLDKNQRNLRNGILSSDSRSLDIVERWQAEKLPEKIYPLTLQTLWTGHPVSIIRWLKDYEPENYEQIGAILMAHDYIRFRLTGEVHAELTNISESNFFNANTGNYDAELLALFGIDEVFSALPPIIKPDQLAGYVTPEIARETGLKVGTQVFGGLFDVVSTAVCSGIDESADSLNYVMGTWSVTSGIADNIPPLDYRYVYGHYVVDGQYIIHEASPTSAGNYEWFVDYLGQNGEFNHQENEALVAALAPASSDLFFVPFLYGSNMGLGLKAGFYGLQAHHSKGQLIQAIWEGILFCHNVHLDRMRVRFPDATSLRVAGGSTVSNVWMQMLADLTGMSIEIPCIEETGSLGAALVAMAGAGEYPSIQAGFKAMHVDIKRFHPNTSHYEQYQRKYRRYLQLVAFFKAFEEQKYD
ncbi:L-xylulose/3-keto-L-gulonate kinase [Marinomonas spartinae]|uniref:L-xylulose/3-keto-L-gulonate kinase n=1 Tax=Marinomonas spartinae TaxID=1792290 RepID=A0A1A8TPV6_9GAMM|nr:FGGY-family carbohydrate kinase [Marinomonas spartinae]SBS35098.1 L-xylulose/3-keto-L-gulonate kinase [Marinomonas spartinae]